MRSSKAALARLGLLGLASLNLVPWTGATALGSAVLPSPALTGFRSNGQGYLGVDVRGLADPLVSGMRLHETHGIVVIAMDHDSPAWQAGVREHDVLLSVNGTAIENEEQFRRMLREMQPGRTVAVVLSRDGNQQLVNATLADREEIGKRAWEQHWVVPAPIDLPDDTSSTAASKAAPPPRTFGQGFLSGHLLPYSSTATYTGLMLDVVTPQLANFFGIRDGNGLLVHSVESKSPAAQAGLQAGDVILRANGDLMRRRSDWTKALRNGKGRALVLVVMRDHHEQTILVTPDAKRRSSLEMPPEPKPRWMAALLPW